MLDPDMPAQELRLHMGELTNDEMLVARAAIRFANSKAEEKLNSIYTQRMLAVRMLALSSGCKYGIGKDGNEDWKDEWRNVVYIDLPEGQVSWHIAIEDMHLFEDFPQYDGEWDGKFSGRDPEFAKSIKPRK